MRLRLIILLSLLLSGCGTPSFLITPVSSRTELEEITVREGKGWSPSKVAIVDVEGMLMDARVGGFLQPQENKVSLFVQQLETIEKDPDVKAVVLRINSPGGTVTGSDIMYQELQRFKAKTKKPVIAAPQEVTASGAFYLACGCDEIVAQPTSVVGSIGVIFETFNFTGTMMKIGVSSDAIKSGPHKDMGSPFKPVSPSDREIMQGMVDEYYKRFVAVVNRHHQLSPVDEIPATDGRIFSGEQAMKIGLVDRVGTLEDALNVAMAKGGVKNARIVMYKRPYGYAGSIYANTEVPQPEGKAMTIDLPGMKNMLPAGFYYLWNP